MLFRSFCISHLHQALSHKYFRVGQTLSTPCRHTASLQLCSQTSTHPSQPQPLAHNSLSGKESSAAPQSLVWTKRDHTHHQKQPQVSTVSHRDNANASSSSFWDQQSSHSSSKHLLHQRSAFNPVIQARPRKNIGPSGSNTEGFSQSNEQKVVAVDKTEAARSAGL